MKGISNEKHLNDGEIIKSDKDERRCANVKKKIKESIRQKSISSLYYLLNQY